MTMQTVQQCKYVICYNIRFIELGKKYIFQIDTLSMTESDSSNQLRLHTLEHHSGHYHEMDSATKKASSR